MKLVSLPADTHAAAKIWNDAMADVIQESRKPAAKRMLAGVCRTGTDSAGIVERKRGKMAGTTGLEPATSDVTGRSSATDSSRTVTSANTHGSFGLDALFDTTS